MFSCAFLLVNTQLIALLLKYWYKIQSKFKNRRKGLMKPDTINNIKHINLEHFQHPRTMVVINYKGKRLSVPLFEKCYKLTQYLNKQLRKFQEKVLKVDSNKKSTGKRVDEDLNHQFYSSDIVCYKVDSKSMLGENQLKINVVLSFIRQKRNSEIQNSQAKYKQNSSQPQQQYLDIDITSIYKYLQIQPYFGQALSPQPIDISNVIRILQPKNPQQKQQHSKSKSDIQTQYFYRVIALLSQSQYCTCFLALRQIDGRYVTINIIDRKYHSVGPQNFYDEKYHYSDQLDRIKNNVVKIYEILQKDQGLLISIQQYCPGGSLNQYLDSITLHNQQKIGSNGQMSSQKSLKDYSCFAKYKTTLPEQQCLTLFKQLLDAVYCMHNQCHIIHGNLNLGSILIDIHGKIKIDLIQGYCLRRKIVRNGKNFHSIERDQSLDPFEIHLENYEKQGFYSCNPKILRQWEDIPEVVQYRKFNSMLDYYSIASIVYQLLTGQIYQHDQQFKRTGEIISLKDILIKIMKAQFLQRLDIVIELVRSLQHSEKDNDFKDVMLPLWCLSVGKQIGSLAKSFQYFYQAQQKTFYRKLTFQEIRQIVQPSKYMQFTEQQQFAYLNPVMQTKIPKKKSKSKHNTTTKSSKSKQKNQSKSKSKSNFSNKSKQKKNKSVSQSNSKTSKKSDSKVNQLDIEKGHNNTPLIPAKVTSMHNHNADINKTGFDSRHSIGNVKKNNLQSGIPKSPKNTTVQLNNNKCSDNVKIRMKSPLKQQKHKCDRPQRKHSPVLGIKTYKKEQVFEHQQHLYYKYKELS